MIPRRVTFFIVGAMVLGALLAAIYRSRAASCHRLLQTAELSVGSQVRSGVLGACYVVGPDEMSETRHR